MALATNSLPVPLSPTISTGSCVDATRRGFLITGVRRYLKPYEDALATVPEKIERVRRLTEDNPVQLDRIP